MDQIASLPTRESVKVLTQTILPFSLHNVNPRSLMGEKEWGKIKKEVQEKANHHCMCCGRYVKHVYGDWIEAHEMYSVNIDKHEFELTGFVGLCNECHSYIHQGRLRILLSEGKISESKYRMIIQYGDHLLNMFGMKKNDLPAKEIENPAWCLL